MSNAPVTQIDPAAFAADPYPTLATMRRQAPITYVPQLDATLITRRNDIHVQEKRIDVFSSLQPDGLMTKLMGENMMRKDGDAHALERRALFPALSPRTVADHWKPMFRAATQKILNDLAPKGAGDLVTDYAMPVSAAALIAITGLSQMQPREMDRVSQHMIDGCANYAGDPQIEARCHAATALIDDHIDRMLAGPPAKSAIAVQQAAGVPEHSLRANVKLVISGGQNEPRDAIAGTVWALLNHPDQLRRIHDQQSTWAEAFGEYVRWISPIGMSPRVVARAETVSDVTFDAGDRVFLMFSSAGRDETHFDAPDRYDITRDTSPAIPFGAGPHFCAGAAASRCLITEIALPMLFDALPNLRLTGTAPFTGWAFRGPTSVPVAWS
ncbi:cytochrome P450 [Sulfitobacter aestuariivivens]|uniref:Cytochrome P450 n=1 Tax=Sulfitobacter aestuariivivens TaxID=2766981 RepID=A0A927D2D5_9RHOB|nr:cytochrome P450 [Sulfitobacter aestuariivivens]MBD3663073.1 cytochrome P450 [Sulfitobacter aestuariivivens]